MNEAFPLKTSPFGLFLLEICEETQDQFEKKFIYQITIANKREVLLNIILKGINFGFIREMIRII